MEAHERELGPVDVVVIGFPADAPMTGDSIPLLLDLVEKGIIRVLDVMFIVKQADGTFAGFEAQNLEPDKVGDFTEFEGASSGLLGDSDLNVAAEAIEPGTAAVLLMYENLWAAPFVTSVRRNGGVLLAAERIDQQDLADVLATADSAA